jgi:hypothetical protein
MINRRKLFGFLAASPVVVPMAAMAKSNEDDAPSSNYGSLVLQNHIKVKQSNVPEWSKMTLGQFYSNGDGVYEKTNVQAAIAVGSDGNLWVRPNNKDKWKRVVTE